MEPTQNPADQVVAGLQKDFKIVGSHRVHSWYAWAIVGIVFGMALGIMYVSSRSAQLMASQAAFFPPAPALNIAVNNEPTSIEFASNGTERYSITSIPVKTGYDARAEAANNIVVNPVTGESIRFGLTDPTVTVSGKTFSVDRKSMQARTTGKPLEGLAVAISRPEGASAALLGSKWVSVRETSRTGSKIVAGQKISFSRTITTNGTPSYAMLSFETTPGPLRVLVNEVPVFDANAKAKQAVSVEVARYIKNGVNEIKFILTQRDTDTVAQDPFGVNYRGVIILNAPATVTVKAQSAPAKVAAQAGAMGQRIAAFTVVNSIAADITLDRLVFDKNAVAAVGLGRLMAKVNGVQYGPILFAGSYTGSGVFSLEFVGKAPLLIARGKTVSVELFADIDPKATSGNYSSFMDFAGMYTTADQSGSVTTMFPVTSGQDLVVSSPVVIVPPVPPTSSTTAPTGTVPPETRPVPTAGPVVTVTTSLIGASSNRALEINDNFATITFAGDKKVSTSLNSIMLSLGGRGIRPATSPIAMSLVDAKTGKLIPGTTAKNCSLVAGAQRCSVTFTFGPAGFAIPKGTSQSFTVRLNSSGMNKAYDAADTIVMTIDYPASLSFNAGVKSSLDVPGVAFPAKVVAEAMYKLPVVQGE
jgi:hypothetical protein